MVETENFTTGNTPLDYAKESIKLVRNSKGFTWEIKTNGTGEKGLFTDEDLKRLKNRNTELDAEYGSAE